MMYGSKLMLEEPTTISQGNVGAIWCGDQESSVNDLVRLERLERLGAATALIGGLAVDALSDAERRRIRMWQIAQQTHWDNMQYQYQQGYLDREYYEDGCKVRVVRLAPTWQALGLTSGRRGFFAEIERLSRE